MVMGGLALTLALITLLIGFKLGKQSLAEKYQGIKVQRKYSKLDTKRGGTKDVVQGYVPISSYTEQNSNNGRFSEMSISYNVQ